MIGSGGGRFEVELKKRIGQEIDRLTSVVVAGDAISDYPRYQNYVGRLQALRLVITDYCEEVETTLNKE